jgi:hypothetical protein
VARWLREHHHDVVSIYDEARGLDDDSVLALATDLPGAFVVVGEASVRIVRP